MRSHPRHAAPRRRRRLRLVPSTARVRRVGRALSLRRVLGRGRTLVSPRALASALRLRERPPLSPERRRARAMVIGALALAAIVLLTSFPVSELLAQRSALASTGRQVSSYAAADRSLTSQLAALDQAGAANALARRDYGFVAADERAFDILPPSGGRAPTSVSSGAVPLDAPPVAPGSTRSQALIGLAASAAPPGTHAAGAPASGATASGPPPGYWGRVLRSLEFWN